MFPDFFWKFGLENTLVTTDNTASQLLHQKLTNLTENDTITGFDADKFKTELMILFLIATSLQFLTTLAFFIFYNKNPIPANIAESRRQSVRRALNENGK